MDCATCKTPMLFLGQLPIRVGGTSGGWHFLSAGLADIGEDVLPLDVYRCGRCKRLEFFDLDLSIPSHLTSR